MSNTMSFEDFTAHSSEEGKPKKELSYEDFTKGLSGGKKEAVKEEAKGATQHPSQDKGGSAAGAFGRAASRNVLPTAAATAAFMPGFTIGTVAGSETGIFAPVVGLVVGLGTSYSAYRAAGYTQDAALSQLPKKFQEKMGVDKETIAKDEQEHPMATFAGGLAPQALFLRPGALRVIPGAIGATIGGGGEAAREKLSGEKLSPARIGMSTVAGALLQTPTSLGKKVMGGGKGGEPPPPPIKKEPTLTGSYAELVQASKDSEAVLKDFLGKTTQATENLTGGSKAAASSNPNRQDLTKFEIQDLQGKVLFTGSPEAVQAAMKKQTYGIFTQVRPVNDNIVYMHAGVPVPGGEEVKAVLANLKSKQEKYYAQAFNQSKKNIPTPTAKENQGALHSLLEEPHPPGVPKNVRELSDQLYQLGQQDKAKRLGALLYADKLVPEGYSKEVAGRRYLAREEANLPEAKRAIKLSPEEQKFESYVKPIRDRNSFLVSSLKRLGEPLDEEGYIHRVVQGKSSVLQQVEGQVPQGKGLGGEASPLKARSLFSAEAGDGNRWVVQRDGEKLNWFYKGKMVSTQDIDPSMKLGEEFTSPSGIQVRLKQATTPELEKHTPFRYVKNELVSEVEANLGLEKTYRERMFLERYKGSPEFRKVAISRSAGAAPKGWKATSLPQFQGYLLKPEVAEALDDFYAKPGMGMAEKLAGINRIAVGSLFWNPLPHVFNVLDHWAVNRGAVDMVNPMAYPRLARTMATAVKEVMTTGPLYRKMLSEGGALMEANVKLEGFTENFLGKLGMQPEAEGLAKSFGYLNPMEMVSRLYKMSRHTLWGVNDMLMMQAYLEKMEKTGASPHEAITETEKHIPSYRVPERVAGSRLLSQALQNPMVTAFGRYDYGRLRAYGEMVKGLVKGSGAEKLHSLDQMAMLGIMGLLVYPYLLDSMAKGLTGNDNAENVRYGTQTIPALIFDLLSGDKQAKEALSGTMPPSPALKSAIEVGSNTSLFTGKPVADWDMGAGQAGMDYLTYGASLFNPFQMAIQLGTEQRTTEQMAYQAIGIKDPSEEQVEKRAGMKLRREKSAERRKAKKEEEE